jgi:porin
MKYFESVLITLLIVLIMNTKTVAQESGDNSDSKKHGGFGGPDQVERQLEEDDEPKQPFFELGFIQPYFDFKSNLKENSGLGFGVDYSAVFLGANESLDLKKASSGMIRLFGSWELVNRGSKNSGALIFKVEHRHRYGTIAPKAFGFNLGYVGLEEPPFNDDNLRWTNFYWRQRLADGKIAIMAGLLDATDYVDVYALASPWLHFMNFAFSTGSQTIYIPNDAALGIAVGLYLTDNIYAIAGISDAGSDPTDPISNFESFFKNNDYFKNVEVGWVTSKDRHFFDNIHLTYWHSDGSDVTASLPGWGIAFSGTYFIDNKWLPFLRGGYAKDGGTLLQKSLTAGVGYLPVQGGNLLGAAIGWGEINETTWASGLDDQITMEVFYRIQLSTRLALTPDLQYVINPALNPDASSIIVWGIRGRMAL